MEDLEKVKEWGDGACLFQEKPDRARHTILRDLNRDKREGFERDASVSVSSNFHDNEASIKMISRRSESTRNAERETRRTSLITCCALLWRHDISRAKLLLNMAAKTNAALFKNYIEE